MRTIKRNTRQARRATGWIGPIFDRMEPRLALSGPDSILSLAIPSAVIEPAPGSVVTRSPASLSIAFDREVDSFSIGAADFALVRVESDGSGSPLAPSEAGLVEAVDPGDPSGSRIVLTPSRPLADGRYRLLLLGTSQLQVVGGPPLAAGGVDREVSTFTVRRPGGGLANAVDLGQATPTVSVRSGELDLAADLQAVRLYRLELPAGHFWRLGLEVSAQAEGPGIDSALALFDARGGRIASASQGRPGSPDDPYLFAGVEPGTYYVGVSGEGNVPGTPGGYNPALGVSGNSGRPQPGGRFTLRFVADPADQPTRVLGLQVDVADPISKTPTGLTLQFSGPIRVDGLLSGGETAVALVDSSGRSWSTTPVHYDESLGQLSVVFDRPMAPGDYTVQALAGGGLTDLAGLVPAAEGLPAGVLGAVTVSPDEAGPEDLGPLLPGVASAGLSSPLEVASGGSAVRRFRIFSEGIYSIRTEGGPAGLRVSLADDRGEHPDLRLAEDPADPTEVYLAAGAYTLTFSNPDGPDFLGTVAIRSKTSSHSSLLTGGAGQGPALNLRLITPAASFGRGDSPDAAASAPAPAAGSSPTSMTTPPSAEDLAPGGINSRPFAGVASPDAAPGPSVTPPPREGGPGSVPATSTASTSSALLYAAVGPVGRPSPAGTPLGVVGPSAPGGAEAIASHQEGLPSGLAAIPAPLPKGIRPGSTAWPLDALPDPAEAAPAPPGAAIDFGLLSGRRGPGPDDEILAEADWIDRVAVMALGRVESLARTVSAAGPEAATVAARPEAPPVPALLADGGRPESTRPSRVQLAMIAPQVGFGMLVMLAYRYRNRLQVGGVRPGATAGSRPRQPILAGPHRKSRPLR